MNISIIDPAGHIPGLKTLFPDADYYSYEPDANYTHESTCHYNNETFKKNHGFFYKTDWGEINSKKTPILFICLPLNDFFDGNSEILEEGSFVKKCSWMKRKISDLLMKNSFERVILFDIYDYDYDPSILNNEWGVDIYFKRNYNKLKKYNNNVHPFPFMMFVKPCVLTTALNTSCLSTADGRINNAIWAGSIYNHVDLTNNIIRNRKKIHDDIKDHIVSLQNVSYDEYLNLLNKFKIGIDLIGVGDPNKRTFEILERGALLMSMTKNLNWGFDPGDSFSEETLFSEADEFIDKLYNLKNDEFLFNRCLDNQNYIIKKYFNKDWMTNYIIKNAGIYEKKKKIAVYFFGYYGKLEKALKHYEDVFRASNKCTIDFYFFLWSNKDPGGATLITKKDVLNIFPNAAHIELVHPCKEHPFILSSFESNVLDQLCNLNKGFETITHKYDKYIRMHAGLYFNNTNFINHIIESDVDLMLVKNITHNQKNYPLSNMFYDLFWIGNYKISKYLADTYFFLLDLYEKDICSNKIFSKRLNRIIDEIDISHFDCIFEEDL